MQIYFFDTSALKYRYVDGRFSRRVRRIISDRRYSCYIADHTILEMSSALGDLCRTNNWDDKRFDKMESWFMDDIACGKLNVCETTKRNVEQARHLIRYAGVVLKRHIKTGDALISSCCRELALELKKKVTFCTQDQRLFNTLNGVSAFRLALRLQYLDPTK